MVEEAKPVPLSFRMTEIKPERFAFDFEAHRKAAVEKYNRKRDSYRDFAETIHDILADAIRTRDLRVNEIQMRAKTVDSFGKKAMTPKKENSDEPKYKDPLAEITDLAGVRVITFFPRTVDEVGQCIQREFEVIEKVDHTATTQQEERLGYQSVHYLVRLADNRRRLPEYQRFDGLIAEVQVRTVMQHAWAEIEHDIRYKSKSAIAPAISRRFMTLAGLLEIADREFQAIQEDDANLQAASRRLIEEKRFEEVEVTADAVHAYLDSRLGRDDRISDFTYEWTARILRGIGFKNLGQVNNALGDLDDDKVSRIVYGTRCGQVTRFEVMLVAAVGADSYLRGYPYGKEEWYQARVREWLTKLEQSGIKIGSYQLTSES